MAPVSDASPIRVALIDDDSGLVTVLERRLGALRGQVQVLAFAPDAGHLAALRLQCADRQSRAHRPGWRYVHTHFGVGYRFAAEPSATRLGPSNPAGSPESSRLDFAAVR